MKISVNGNSQVRVDVEEDSSMKISVDVSEDCGVFFVERIGKFGSKGWEFDNFDDAMRKAEEAAKEKNVLSVRVWN